jgi:hypothetical protein
MLNENQNENLTVYIEEFFDELELYDDKYNNHTYKDYFHLVVSNFLENENEYNASEVYRLFFEIYQITGEDKSKNKDKKTSNDTESTEGELFLSNDEPDLMLELVETLKKYEKSTGDLIERQRDHYIHSVNVFILGLAIFSQNENYRDAFLRVNNDGYYNSFYETSNEEFFYRWGIASLFHDIGYPLEIIGKQMKKFIKEGVNSISNQDIAIFLSFKDFKDFNTIVKKDSDFPNNYREIYNETNFIDLFKPLDILAHKISLVFEDIELIDIKKNLDSFVGVMANNGFIDHGFYSAILVTLYYGYLIQKYGKKSEFFFFPIVDSASAILLHNYYRNVLMSKNYEFRRENMKVNEHPIAYLLILCDELQEWNRQPFGVEDKKKYHANESKIEITNDYMDVEYIIKNGTLSPSFGREKSELLYSILDIFDMFKRGLSVNTLTEDKVEKLIRKIHHTDINTPKQVISNIEELAKVTHDFYNELREKQGKRIEFKTFNDLSNDMKYSNFRQARSIPNKLSLIGCEIVPIKDKRKEIKEFQEWEIEKLAIIEHDEWVKERISTGWVFDPVKNVEKKKSPYLVPWNELEDKIKDYDREPVQNIPEILNIVGMKVVQKKLRIIAFKTHDYFTELMKEENKSYFTENFNDLPLEIQESNFKQSEAIPELLDKVGYRLVSKEDEGISINKFSIKELDEIARLQHENWLIDREIHGWKQGYEKNDNNKINPNIQSWDKLSNKMKKVNKKVIKRLPIFLNEVDMKIVKN